MKPSGSPRRSITSSMRQACHPRLARRLGHLVSSSVSIRAVGASRASHQMKGKQASKQASKTTGRGEASSGSRLVVLPRPPCGGRAIPGSHDVPVVPVVASFPSSPVSKQAAKERDKGKTRGSGERRKHVGLDNHISGSSPGRQMRTSKQDENGRRPRPIPIISRPTGPISCPINQSPRSPDKQDETTNETTGTTGGRRSEQQTDGRDENARASQDDKQATRRTTRRQTRRGARRRRQGKKQAAVAKV